MITAAALGLSQSLTDEETSSGLLYPRLERIREVSASVAARVVKAAQEGQVDTAAELRGLSTSLSLKIRWDKADLADDHELVEKIKEMQWKH
jgi:malate dehydrogenase (oxaloacetate-decarboxylating)(NADP+)